MLGEQAQDRKLGSAQAGRGEAGIGLAIVRAIAVAHGGSVIATNNDTGVGATVSIRIPLNR